MFHCFEKSIALNPNDSEAFIKKGLAQRKLMRRD